MRIFKIGLEQIDDKYLRDKVYLANVFAVTQMVITTIYGTIGLFSFASVSFLPYSAVAILSSTFLLNQKGHYYASRLVVSLTIPFLYLFYQAMLNHASDKVIGPLLLAQIFFSIMPFLLFDQREWRTLLCLCIFLILGITVQEVLNQAIAWDVDSSWFIRPFNKYFTYFIISFLLATVLLVFQNRIYRTEKENDELINRLNNSNDEVKQLNVDLLQSNRLLTEQKEKLSQTVNALELAQTQLVQSEKMRAVGVLTAGIAHEINNPLNYIVGGCEVLSNHLNIQDKHSDPVLSTTLTAIKTGAKRATDIVQGINQLSRDSERYDEACHITDIMENCISILRNQMKFNVDVEKEIDIDVPTVLGNSGKLHQVILNLLQNALDAMQNEGTLRIEVKLRGQYVVTKIKDSGLGIRSENLHKIWDPFYTTKEPGKGTGLGLSICKNIIEKHNGDLTATSSWGDGTTFTLSLPI